MTQAGDEPADADERFERFEEVGRLLAKLDPDALKLTAVIRHLMAQHDVDLVGAVAMLDDTEVPEAIAKVWQSAKALSNLAMWHLEPHVLAVESQVSAFSGEPKVLLRWRQDENECVGSFSPMAARHHAYSVLEAAEASEHDAALHALVREGGGDAEEAAGMVSKMGDLRRRYREAQGEPQTYRGP